MPCFLRLHARKNFTMFSKFFYYVCISFVLLIVMVNTDYVTYIKTEQNKFEPGKLSFLYNYICISGLVIKYKSNCVVVMEPVSSTIESVPLYKIVKKLSYTVDDAEDYQKNQLLTGSCGPENINYRRGRTSKN